MAAITQSRQGPLAETSPPSKKRGTANVVFKEEDNSEETEVKVDGMPTREYLLQMISISNPLVGNVINTEEPAVKAEGCGDGDTMINLGFTTIQIGGTYLDADTEDQDQGAPFAEAKWKVQGVRGTNPVKIKKKIKTTSKSDDTAHASMIKVDKKPAFFKNCMKRLNYVVALASASSRSAKTVIKKSEYERYTFDRWKMSLLYLNSCATHHLFFAKDFLRNTKDGDTTLTGSCNTGTTVTITPEGNKIIFNSY